MMALSTAATVIAVLLIHRPGARVALARLSGPRHRARTGRAWAAWPVLPACCASGIGMAVGGGISVALAAIPVAGTLSWVIRAQLRRKRAEKCRLEVVRSCQILAGLLRIGHVPVSSLSAAATDAPLFAEPAAVQSVGGTVGPVLRRLGQIPGQEGLVELANAWEVSERTGASMTATLDALAVRLADDTALRNVVRSELSAPRATGRLLGALPLVGVGLGYALGGDPVGYLTGSLAGQVCLVAGVFLGCAGVVWTERISDAEARP